MLLCGASAQGASVSPESCSTGTPPVGPVFFFQADALGGSSLFPRNQNGLLLCMFNNQSGADFNSLAITTALPTGASLTAYSCDGNLFNLCNVALNPAGNTLIFNFSLGAGSTGAPPVGVPAGKEFAINLGTGGFAPNQTFLVAANGATIPEPASAILFLAGIACFLAKGRARQKAT